MIQRLASARSFSLAARASREYWHTFRKKRSGTAKLSRVSNAVRGVGVLLDDEPFDDDAGIDNQQRQRLRSSRNSSVVSENFRPLVGSSKMRVVRAQASSASPELRPPRGSLSTRPEANASCRCPSSEVLDGLSSSIDPSMFVHDIKPHAFLTSFFARISARPRATTASYREFFRSACPKCGQRSLPNPPAPHARLSLGLTRRH